MKRFHFIRFLCCTFCCALSILQCFSSQAEQSQSYSTLRTECPDAFQYSTTVGNAVINVDAPIVPLQPQCANSMRRFSCLTHIPYRSYACGGSCMMKHTITEGLFRLGIHQTSPCITTFITRALSLPAIKLPALIFCPRKQPTRWNSYVRPMAYRRIFAFGRNMPPVGCMPSPTALPPMKPHLCDKTSL